MNIKRENIGLLNDLITIELLASDYQEQVEKSLRDLKRKANVPGFRPGHVPMGMIEKMYKKAVIVEEVSKLTNDEISKYLTENIPDMLFEPIAHEDKTEGDFEKAEDFRFSFEVGIRPEIVINYAEAKKVTNYKVVAADKEIDKEVMDMRLRVGKFSSTEVVADRDMLLVSVNRTDGQGEEFTSSLMLDHVKDAELKAFIGKKLEAEMDIDTVKVFKSDEERAAFLKVKAGELENFPAMVHIKINAIHHRELAEMNEEFYSKLFPDGSITDEKTLRGTIAAQIELRHTNDTDAMFRNQVLEVILEKTTVGLPDDFIKRFLVKNREQYTAENIEEKYDMVKKSVEFQLIEDQIAKDCGIAIEDEDVMQYLESYIRMSYFGTLAKMDDEMEKQVAAFVQKMMKNQENIKNAYDNIFYGKMTEGLKEKLNPKSKSLTFEEFIAEISDKKDKKPKTAAKKEEKPVVAEGKEEPKDAEEKPKVAKPKAKKKVETE
jgi:trigger factor